MLKSILVEEKIHKQLMMLKLEHNYDNVSQVIQDFIEKKPLGTSCVNFIKKQLLNDSNQNQQQNDLQNNS